MPDQCKGESYYNSHVYQSINISGGLATAHVATHRYTNRMMFTHSSKVKAD